MIRVKFDNQLNRISISFLCKLSETKEREFNLNRDLDESLGATFEKLYANYNKHAEKKSKKVKKSNDNEHESVEKRPSSDNESDSSSILQLFDLENKLVELETKNKQAWVEDYTFKLKDQLFKVRVNLPAIQRIALPKVLIAGMPAIVKIETDCPDDENSSINKNSLFNWYTSDCSFSEADKVASSEKGKNKVKAFDLQSVKWNLIDSGVGKKICYLSDKCANSLVKVECMPSDGKREGVAVQAISSNPVAEPIEIEKMPMSERHQLTKSKLQNNEYK
jgi:hypothetical protein